MDCSGLSWSVLVSVELMGFVSSADLLELSLCTGCVQEDGETTESGINPELAKVCGGGTAELDLFIH